MHRRCSMFVETRWHDVELRLPIRTDCDELRNGAAIGSLVASDLAKTVRTNVVEGLRGGDPRRSRSAETVSGFGMTRRRGLI